MEREEMLVKIKETVEQLRPYLQMDGGDIEFVELTEDATVRVRLQGHCCGCPGASYTLKLLVERKLKEIVPEITGVESVA